MLKLFTSRFIKIFATLAIFAGIIGLVSLYLTEGIESKSSSTHDDFNTKFVQHTTPIELPDFTVDLPTGAKTLADFRGRFLIINLWATWCAPCRRGMPQFENLQNILGDRADVIALSLDRGKRDKPDAFLDSLGITSLLRAHDGGQKIARQIGLFGVPTTLFINEKGQEVARLQGEAIWDGAQAQAAILGLIGK